MIGTEPINESLPDRERMIPINRSFVETAAGSDAYPGIPQEV